MLDNIIKLIFSWEKLRLAVFAEVDWYNSITRTLNDPDSMKTASAFWCEEDGWRGWGIKDDGSYYFHDVPEKHLSDIFDIIIDKETVY
ncbi:MAG: hypothetical protein ACK5P0_01410 [bacterium]|jgi:hypothetical protein